MQILGHEPSHATIAGAETAFCDWVILLHGLFATRRSMRKLARHVACAGYRVLNWSYPTMWRSTDQHVQRLLPELFRLQADDNVRTINFVAHSMGGILVRSALHELEFPKVKRLVMLAPPNRGSHLTRIKLGPFAWCFPSIAELTEEADSLPNRLTISSRIEVGVIAAERDPIVQIANTHLPNERDHRVLATSHFKLPNHEGTIRQVIAFLQTGVFLSSLTDVPEGEVSGRSAA